MTEQIKGNETVLPAVTTECSLVRVPRHCLGVLMQMYFIQNLAIILVCVVKYSLAGLTINFTKCFPTSSVFTF